jgi:cell division protein FtsW
VLHPFSEKNYKFAGWQTAHSVMGLASGGFFGVGLGASRQKWANLSEANTDFIFSVIGEEMGLIGTLVVLTLYAILIFFPGMPALGLLVG